MERNYQLSSNAAMVRLDINSEPYGSWAKMWNIYSEKPIDCDNVGDMLIKLDILCENLKFPMAAVELRSFDDAEVPQEKNTIKQPKLYHAVNAFNLHEVLRQKRQIGDTKQTDLKKVFYIHVLYRRDASIQGIILCPQNKASEKKQHFRSGLELIKIIQDELQKEDIVTRKKEKERFFV